MRERAGVDVTTGLPFESLTITALGRDTRLFDTLLQDARRLAMAKDTTKTVVYTSWANEWRPFGAPHPKRPLDSVVLDAGVAEHVVRDVQAFQASQAWYYARGRAARVRGPRHRGAAQGSRTGAGTCCTGRRGRARAAS